MRSKVLSLVILALACVSIAQPASAAASPSSGRASASVKCFEDQPCWDWAIMGNRSRGIVTRYGTPLVVKRCRFAKLYRRGLVDYPPSQRMRGDRTALRLCR